ncbi:MAG: HsdR family type I site-specific deoxyribonuclease [Candidatus Accumulibacter sp.]|uniref:Type I restriction enzyme endonuclease subunit n=1 Tax=Candidatus Accumulibacter affinis TaxID=2954384 RepID=A0A935T750_9PROT|nr:HsdR family type I site-specific deoxyribonuclease [Candidatus Accumulibacter affinis]
MPDMRDSSALAYEVRTLFNEETTVEREIIEHLKAAKLGWTWRSRDYLKTYRPDEREVLLLPLLREKLKALNPAVLTDDARVDAIITKLRGCRDNQQWLVWLKDGVNYKFDAAENAQDVRLIDYENLDANDWWVTNQFSIDGRSTRRPDIVLLINGIPIVVIEAKTASRSKPDWREGAKQLGMYAEEIDQLFYTNAYGVGVNETRMMYGVPGRRLQFWLQWRDPWPHEIDEFDEMKVSLYGLFDRGNLLDFIRHFVVFVTRDGKTEKVVVRYQQYLAVKDILKRATDLTLPAEKRRGLIWHTQGSGKTLTMIYAARSLWEDPKLKQPTVILLVHREQLGDQMERELASVATENVHIATTKKDLEAYLSGNNRGICLTTIHLFDGMPSRITNMRNDVIVMADEAHHSQERDLGTYMRSALAGASLFGFTGTPIENDDHNTPKAWGYVKDDGKIERYMGRPYTVTDALRDGVVKPIHWQPRVSDWQLHGKKLDLAFKREFGHLPEEEQNQLTTGGARLDALLFHPTRISQIADDVAQHFIEHVRPNGFKGMLVCKDKQAVKLYATALRERLGDEVVMAVISEAPQNDPKDIQALYLGEARRKKLLNEFLIAAQSENEEHRDKVYRKVEILVVCDMLLTGFDAPILQALYLDKKLLNHTLLQTIARANRPYNELKGHGLVLDYYGIFDDLNEALNYRPDELGDVAFPFETIREHFRKTFQLLWDLFPLDTVPRDGSHDAFVTAMRILRDEEGAEKQFDTGYRNLRVLYEALQPDEQLRDHVRPYAWLTKLYMLYRKKFYPDASKSIEATEEDAARTRELIREHIDVDELETEFPTYVLDEHFLTKLKDKKPDAKALDIEAMLSAELRIRLDQDDAFRPLSEKLQRLIDEKRAGTLAGIALIEELEKLTDAVRAAVEETKRPVAQQLALKIKARNTAITDDVAAKIAAATLAEADKHCFPGWWGNSTVDPELSRGLLFMIATRFSSAGLLTDDAMGFVGSLVQVLRRRHYKPSASAATGDDGA